MIIAICDDDVKFCNTLNQLIQTYLHSVSLEAKVKMYLTGEELCQAFQEQHDIDLIFLDIELTGMNGVGVGQFLRQSNHNDIQIVYVSAKEGYAMQLFQNRPFDFLVKPIMQKRLDILLNEYFRIYPLEDRYFSFTSDRKKSQIAVSEIIYFESMRKQLRMVTANSESMIYSKLTDILALPFSQRFLRIHQSFLVNIQHIAEFRYGEVILTNGSTLPISRSYQTTVRDYLMKREQERMIREAGI